MTSLTRILRQNCLPPGHRAYSSFFSSKSGGGRYFNSAKSSKPAVVASKSDSPSAVDSAAPDTQVVGETAPQPPASPSIQPDSSQFTPSLNAFENNILAPHPHINAKEFKLHQFFSLHRPLLLLSEPSTLLQTAPTKGPLYASKTAPEDSLPPPPPIGKYGAVFDDAPVFSTEADSETARQLMRSLTLNRAGGAVAWDETLQRLGLVTEVDPQTMEQMKQDWNDVMMDSTKRKRRKKMKKHKLKKRRRATRATRLKIGR